MLFNSTEKKLFKKIIFDTKQSLPTSTISFTKELLDMPKTTLLVQNELLRSTNFSLETHK